MKMIVQSQKGACLCSWLCTSKYSKTANYSWLKTRQAKANQNKTTTTTTTTKQHSAAGYYIVDALFIRLFLF
jgi:hypothetical protein